MHTYQTPKGLVTALTWNEYQRKKMENKRKKQILDLCKRFTKGMKIPINGSGLLIVDPLSGYLNTIGFKNTLMQIPGTENRHMVLIITFEDGTQLIPAGLDLKTKEYPEFKNWMWL